MKKLILVLAILICNPFSALALDFGDGTSNQLVQKGWAALSATHYQDAIAYANRVIQLYSAKAHEMQSSLTDFPSGSKDDVFQYWALNDVGTAEFILAEAERKSGSKDEALATYQKIVDEYSFAQCWDNHGWFWRIASVAQDKLNIAKAGVNLDFGDYNSNALVQKAWASMDAKDLKAVTLYTQKVEELYGSQAREMQSKLTSFPEGSWKYKQDVLNYWALNDVGTALFILAESNYYFGDKEEAFKIYHNIIDHYYYAQCWNNGGQGWFWKPVEVAQKRLKENHRL